MKYEGFRCYRQGAAGTLACLLIGAIAIAATDVGSPSTTSHGIEDDIDAHAAAGAPPSQRFDYPHAQRVQQVDTYHGVEVRDPYRWLEDPDAPETRAFASAQDALTAAILNDDARFDAYRERFLQLQSESVYGSVQARGDRVFYLRRPVGAGSRPALGVLASGAHRILLDSERRWPTDTRQVQGYAPDRSGERLVLTFSNGPGTPVTLRVLDVATGELLPDTIGELAAGSSAQWVEALDGFVYTAYPIPAGGSIDDIDYTNQQVRFHELGTDVADDRVLHARPDDPSLRFGVAVTHDGDELFIAATEARRNVSHPFILDLTRPDAVAQPLEVPGESIWNYVDDNDDGYLLYTRFEAPRARLVRIDPEQPEGWYEVVPQRDDALAGVTRAGDRLVATYVVDARREVHVFDRDGRHHGRLDIAGIGRVTVSGSPHVDGALVGTGHVGDPGTTWRADLQTLEVEPLLTAETSIDPDDYVIEQTFVTSADGTRVPVSMVRRSDLHRDGTNPVFVYGYGAWSWAAFPYFQAHWHMWIENGGIFAVPNIRGGGEYGEDWHQAGIKRNKRNAFDDMIAAAEWFAESGWSAPGRIVANGGSASGLLAAAVAMMRPDLFGGAVIDHPGLDLLRAQAQPGGQFLVPEYGSVEDPEEFEALLDISPYHNVEEGTCYPPMLVTVGEADRTTVPMHGLKFIAAVQHASSCDNPALLEWVPNGGHLVFGTTPEEQADILSRQLLFARRAAQGAWRRAAPEERR